MIIKLYIAGDSEKSRLNAADVEKALVRMELDSGLLEIVDVLQQPQAAMGDEILATPTLLVQSAAGTRRVVGDFGNTEKMMKVLDFGNTVSVRGAE